MDTTDKNNINSDLSSSMAKGTTDQTNAHSLGIMFEQSINQQQNHFQTAISTSTMDVKKILSINTGKKNRIEKINNHRFFNL